jgi:hypothetical protein
MNRGSLKSQIILWISALLSSLMVFGCGNGNFENAPTFSSPRATPIIQMAQKIKIGELKKKLTQLKNHETEYDFFGITSNGVDCIYFVLDGEKFNLEFEAMVSDQKAYIKKLQEWSDSNHFKSTMTTYNNEPKYPSNEPAPVIHIETHCSLEEAAKIGRQIESEIFGNSDTTAYEIVP